MNYYIGADLGTSGLKFLLVDAKGEILNSVTKNYDVSYPNPGWSEQNPEDWWPAFVGGIGELTKTLIQKASSVRCIVLLNKKALIRE